MIPHHHSAIMPSSSVLLPVIIRLVSSLIISHFSRSHFSIMFHMKQFYYISVPSFLFPFFHVLLSLHHFHFFHSIIKPALSFSIPFPFSFIIILHTSTLCNQSHLPSYHISHLLLSHTIISHIHTISYSTHNRIHSIQYYL